MFRKKTHKNTCESNLRTLNDSQIRLLQILIISTTFIIFSSVCQVFAQISTEELRFSRSELLPGYTKFKAGALKKFILGSHYRAEWTTPVNVPILDLENSAGGLTPLKKSGGKQSKSLSFSSAEGGRFFFRSIEKDPSKVLPPELRGTIVADALKDGCSTAHPYAPLIVPPLAEAVGVLHTNPKLVVLPDDERLGPFREEFQGVVGMMEEFVINGPDETPGFAGLTKVVGTEELLKILEQSYDDFVDQKSYLKARLLDIFLSDWDRHFDQWRWARIKKEGKNLWYPIPLDRDQALVKFDGLLTSIAENRYIVPQLEGLEKKSPDIWSLTYQARHSDCIFLNSLSENEFREISAEFIQQLSDEVLEKAVLQLPQEVYNLSGKRLLETLKKRRSLMDRNALSFYKNLASHVKIMGRDKPEYFEIEHIDNNHVVVKAFQRDETNGNKTGEVLYQRVFVDQDTKEIRIYLLAGDDKIQITGTDDSNILVRIIGGPGDDEFIDQSKSKTLIYDTKSNTKILAGDRTVFYSGSVDSVINAYSYKPRFRSYGHLSIPVPFIFGNSEDGLLLGGGVKIRNYGFRKEPYANSLYLSGKFASNTGAIQLSFSGKFIKAILGMGLNFAFKYDPIEVTNYYGFGNDSERNSKLERGGFYRVHSQQISLNVKLSRNLFNNIEVFWGSIFKRFEIDLERDESRFIIETKPYGVDIKNLLELNTGIRFDSRDIIKFPSKGIFLEAGISYFPEVFDNTSSFAKGAAESRFYISPLNEITFAIRVRGEKVWNSFPFYEAAYLGGTHSLRSFRDERFGGDASALGNAEFRFKLFRPTIILPMDFGVFIFGEAGRAWFNGASPEDWHTGTGGGIWFSPIYRFLTFSTGIAKSTEGIRWNLCGGFAF